jgi:hypothetical protein
MVLFLALTGFEDLHQGLSLEAFTLSGAIVLQLSYEGTGQCGRVCKVVAKTPCVATCGQGACGRHRRGFATRFVQPRRQVAVPELSCEASALPLSYAPGSQ